MIQGSDLKLGLKLQKRRYFKVEVAELLWGNSEEWGLWRSVVSGAVTSVEGDCRTCRFGSMSLLVRKCKIELFPWWHFITFNLHRHGLLVFPAVLLKLIFNLLRFICYKEKNYSTQLREMAKNLWTRCNMFYISPSFKNSFPNGKCDLHGQCGKFIKHKKSI